MNKHRQAWPSPRVGELQDEQHFGERRFLDQLARVKKFSFLVTQLALSWEKDGVWKTMLFDKRQPRPADK